MSKGIKVSEKHGVNPTIPLCFWCGKEKNEIALLGKMKGDVEAPKNVVLDYEPCDECKKVMAQGIHTIEVVGPGEDDSIKNPPINKGGLKPTGRWMMLNPNFFRDNTSEELAEQITKAGKTLMDKQMFQQILDAFANTNEGVKADEK